MTLAFLAANTVVLGEHIRQFVEVFGGDEGVADAGVQYHDVGAHVKLLSVSEGELLAHF